MQLHTMIPNSTLTPRFELMLYAAAFEHLRSEHQKVLDDVKRLLDQTLLRNRRDDGWKKLLAVMLRRSPVSMWAKVILVEEED